MQANGPQQAPAHADASREPGSRARGLLGGLQGLLFLVYPLAIYLAYTRLQTRALGLVLIGLLAAGMLARMRGSLRGVAPLVKQHLGIVALVALAMLLNQRVLLLFLPAAVSCYLLFTFHSSLRRGPPMIERFARIVEADLPDFTLPYCRTVTQVWCGFFAFNAVTICVLASTAPLGWWAIYTGIIFYLLLGLLLGGEFVFRKLWFRYYTGGAVDTLLSRLFPAERSERGRRSLAHVAGRRD